MSERAEIVAAARRAVLDGCRVARAVRAASSSPAALAKIDESPVTVADFAAQAVVIHRLRERLGPVRVVAEEDADVLHRLDDGALVPAVLDAARVAWPDATTQALVDAIGHGVDASPEGAPFWALDPIDGTKGFLRGGQFAVCLARIEGGQPTLGVLGCPHLSADLQAPLDRADPIGTLLVGNGEGASWQPLQDDATPQPITIARALPERVTVTRSYESTHTRGEDVQRVLEGIDRPIDELAVDSQVKYALVARGRAQIYLRLPVDRARRDPVWDHAAGAAVAAAAGMIVTDAQGAPLRWGPGPLLADNLGILCAHPRIHGTLASAVRGLLATER